MRRAVSVVFTFADKIFAVKRQEYLSVFPGYLAFPGGKVDKTDEKLASIHPLFKNFEGQLIHALGREVQEELNIDLFSLPIKRVERIATAITPEFNPYRFETIFYWVELSKEVEFNHDEGEVEDSFWIEGRKLIQDYYEGKHLAVPPTVRLIERFSTVGFSEEEQQLRLPYDPEKQVPWIESISGVRQFLPLSNTFPPANRTNCFLIGKTLIDPSPKDEDELIKLMSSFDKKEVERIFLTHHHPDHHEFAPRMAKELGVPILISSDSKKRILRKWGSDYFNSVQILEACEEDIIATWNNSDVYLMAVPGHDEGQLAPYVKSGEWVLAGDLFQTVGTVVIGGDEGDMQKYFDSLQKVIDFKPRFIIPSHGIAMGGTYKLEMTLKHRKHREKQILSLYKSGKSNEEIFEEVYEGLEERLKKYALATIQKHLDKLKAEGKIT